MAKRLFDLCIAVIALVALSPVLVVAALAVRLSSAGPILYRATRVGSEGRPFVMYKFRTMEKGGGGPAISARNDARVFPVGALLRKLKVDELPQLLNVVLGDMSLVGPRPEDATIVKHHYTPLQLETLNVRPGLASPGSIYNYTHGEKLLEADSVENVYVEKLLPTKLALDLVYVKEQSFLYDLTIIWRTIVTILSILVGVTEFPEPPELYKARSVYGFI